MMNHFTQHYLFFELQGRPAKKPGKWYLNELEYKTTHLHILLNCPDIEPCVQKHSKSPTKKPTRILDVGKYQRVRRKRWRVPTDFKISDGISDGLACCRNSSNSVGIICGSRDIFLCVRLNFGEGVCFASDSKFRERRSSSKRRREKREKVKLGGFSHRKSNP